MLNDAIMITAGDDPDAAIILSTTVRLTQEYTQAHLDATACGIYEIRIDGTPISGSVLAPGWSSYPWRHEVQRYMLEHRLRDGSVIEVLLGNGWWRGGMGFDGGVNYGDEIGFIAELKLRSADLERQKIVTGLDWKARQSDTTFNSFYHGQTIDARLRDRVEPLEVREVEFNRSALVSGDARPPVTRQDVLRPVGITTSPSGKTLVDFGQNLVGWVRLTARGEAGAVIVVRHAEVLEGGELGTRPLRAARAMDTFILSGDGEEMFEPTLTFHGFRYAEVSGYPGTLTDDAIAAIVVHSDMRRTGRFTCSNELVNRLVENSLWSQRGNFLSIPTDCPQRDERLGWTGDIAAYAATAACQFDVADFLHPWLLDLAAETRHAGFVPWVVPDILGMPQKWTTSWARNPTAVWGDAACWVPEALWWAYGDEERLREHYPAMVLHLESVERVLSPTGPWDTGFQFGDWLDPDAPPDDAAAAKAETGVVATACLYRSARFTAHVAGLLTYTDDAQRWSALAERTRSAFLNHYVESDGRIRSDCATVYALAIRFGLLDGGLRAAAGERLAALVAQNDYRVSTGFAGTPFVTFALTDTGHVEAAYRLLLEEACPSWLYPVTMGATTIWERWDSMLPDGSINPGDMTSFNHYALGAVVDWLFKAVAGIQPAEPGYARLRLAPIPGPGLDWAHGALDTRHGRVECGWRRIGDEIQLTAVVPDGIEADVVLPDGSTTTVAGGEHVFRYRA